VQGRWRLALWLRSPAPNARLHVTFGRQGRPNWLDRVIVPGADWQAVEIVFDTLDDGPAGGLMLALGAEEAEVQVDDIELGAALPAGPGGFRPELVDTLRALRPGYLRDWQGQLADTPANRVAGPLARRPYRYRPGASELQFGYSLPEFLALCAAVGARPWVVLPSTTTPDEGLDWGRALAEGWRLHHFDEIVVEHGNEHWNQIFRPAGIGNAVVLAQVADRTFAALRMAAGSQVPLHRVVGTQYVDGAAAGRMAAATRQTEGIAVAPYFHFRQDAADSVEQALDRALHEDVLPLREAVAGTRAQGRALDVYEVNFHTTGGSASSEQRNAVVTGPGAGAALMRRLLQAAAAGAQRQAVYTLAGYDAFAEGGKRELVQLFGIARDLAGPAHWRPTGQAVAALNAVAGGAASAAACTGSACAEITALNFGGGARWAIVSSAPQPLQVAVPCTRPLRLQGPLGPLPEAACVKGLAEWPLAPRSWVTAAPA